MEHAKLKRSLSPINKSSNSNNSNNQKITEKDGKRRGKQEYLVLERTSQRMNVKLTNTQRIVLVVLVVVLTLALCCRSQWFCFEFWHKVSRASCVPCSIEIDNLVTRPPCRQGTSLKLGRNWNTK